MKKLEWGLSHAVPEDAPIAWGARAIWEGQHGNKFSLLYDRQDCQTDDESLRKEFGKNLDLALAEARKTFTDLVNNYKLRWDEEKEVVLSHSNGIKMVGNPNGSFGYLYIAAWPE